MVEQLDIFTQGRPTAKRPQDMVEEACIWIRDNRDAFWALMRICEEAEANPAVNSIGRDYVYTIAMFRGTTIENKSLGVLRAHSPWSAISRYLLMMRPKLSRIIHPVQGNIDTVDFAATWHAIVESRTTFFARDWIEAREMYEQKDACAQ